ncbi:MAG: hypothetical protein WC824_08085 [Bacteroidota bacterium]|jgi:hypothetical protein
MGIKRWGVANGSIPDSITVVLRTKVGYKTPGGAFKAKAAFVTDTKSKGSLDTAKRWADGYGAGKTGNPEVVTQDNDTFPSLRVVDLDARSEGGRAWKAITPEGWYVDLREDVILDVFKAGCVMQKHPDGGLNLEGPFRWVKYGTQMRIALLDSDIYREIAVSNQLKAKAKIGLKDIEIGGVYLSSGRKVAVYLGRVVFKGKKSLAWVHLNFYGDEDKDPAKATPAGLQAKFNEVVKDHHWAFEVTQSCGYSEKIGIVKVPPDPDKWFDYGHQFDWVEDPVATAQAKFQNTRLDYYNRISVPVLVKTKIHPLTWL